MSQLSSIVHTCFNTTHHSLIYILYHFVIFSACFLIRSCPFCKTFLYLFPSAHLPNREAMLCDPSYGCCSGTLGISWDFRILHSVPVCSLQCLGIVDVECMERLLCRSAQARDAALPFLDAVAACLEVRRVS